jgi:histidyl-tRNA synthetase
MKDVQPEEMARRLWITDRILKVLQNYGFKVMEPTTIESLKTLEAKSGPDIKNEIYWFKDKAGRSLGLRFDLTVGMARMVANRFDIPEPIKLCAISGSWRYDEPQFGRYRYFTQWDAEIFGSKEILADAEAISVGIDVLEALGLKEFEVRISNRKLIEGTLTRLGLKSKRRLEEALRVIDKFRKISRKRALAELAKLGFEGDRLERVTSLIDISGPPEKVLDEVENQIAGNEKAQTGFRELVQLIDMLKGLGKASQCIYDLSIVRGIGYYDGIVFEAYDRGNEDIGAIFGGGRYDGLCGIYGKRAMPATGVAGGIDRVMLSLERAKLYPRLPLAVSVFVARVNDSVLQETLRLVSRLRGYGISSDFDLKGRPLGRQLEYADSLGIPYALIVGPEEVAKGTVKLRNMSERAEIELQVDEAIKRLKEELAAKLCSPMPS